MAYQVTKDSIIGDVLDYDKDTGVFFLEIRDFTLPLYGTEQLKNDPTIIGEFFRSLLPMLENGTPDERRVAAKALRVGIAALKGEDVTG